MELREATQAANDLMGAGYTVVPYPDKEAPTNLIVKQGDRTVTTLAVTDGGVCEDSVAYLVSEGHHEKIRQAL